MTKQGLDSQIQFIEHFREIGCSLELLYPSMRATKELAYCSDILETKHVISLFSEINEKYMNEPKGILDFIPKGLSALIQGKYVVSSFYKILYSLWLLKKKYIYDI